MKNQGGKNMNQNIYFLEKQEETFTLKDNNEEIISTIQASNIDTCLELLSEEMDINMEISSRTDKQCTVKTIYGEEETAIIRFAFYESNEENPGLTEETLSIFDNEKILVNIINKYESLEDFFEALDTCADLYDLGYIESQSEQNIYDKLAELSALKLWAIYMYVKDGSQNYFLSYEDFLSSI